MEQNHQHRQPNFIDPRQQHIIADPTLPESPEPLKNMGATWKNTEKTKAEQEGKSCAKQKEIPLIGSYWVMSSDTAADALFLGSQTKVQEYRSSMEQCYSA